MNRYGDIRTRHGFPRGERHPKAKLEEADIRHIRAYYAKGLTNKQLAEYYGVEVSTIWKIVRGINWSHVK